MNRVLVLPASAETMAKQMFSDYEVTAVDRTTDEHRNFDVVFTYNFLPTLAYREAGAAVKEWKKCLRAGGEMVIIVPSLEWAAEQILKEFPSPILMQHLFGIQSKQGEFYVSGWTLLGVRELMEKAYCAVRNAKSGNYVANLNGKDYEAEMHIVRGVKR